MNVIKVVKNDAIYHRRDYWKWYSVAASSVEYPLANIVKRERGWVCKMVTYIIISRSPFGMTSLVPYLINNYDFYYFSFKVECTRACRTAYP